MVNVQELRIGNAVYKKDLIGDGNGIRIIDRLHFITAYDIYHIVEDDDPTNHPISLTPEWLERCGFVKLNHLGNVEYSLVINEELTVEACIYDRLVIRLVTENENHDENVNVGSYVTYQNIDKCKHLHQLQNLYFALTGEELTIQHEHIQTPG